MIHSKNKTTWGFLNVLYFKISIYRLIIGISMFKLYLVRGFFLQLCTKSRTQAVADKVTFLMRTYERFEFFRQRTKPIDSNSLLRHQVDYHNNDNNNKKKYIEHANELF